MSNNRTERPEAAEPVKTHVEQWLSRIKRARTHFKDDFERMDENTQFASGFQWANQEKLNTDKYVANITLRTVSQKVAILYARNPTAVAKRRERMDYELWDGDLLHLQEMVMRAYADPMDLEAQAFVADYEQGKAIQDYYERVAKMLERQYDYEVRRQEPEFKLQMKQLVRRVVVTGVGFARVSFVREYEEMPSASAHQSSIKERLALIKSRIEEIGNGDIDNDDSRVEQLRMLMNSVQSSQEQYAGQPTERLVFDFPPSTDIVIDPRCRLLKGFVGARWIAQRYELTLDEVNSFFDLNIKRDEVKLYDEKGKEDVKTEAKPKEEEGVCCVYEVFDKTTKSRFFLLDGFKDYLKAPEPVSPCLHRFWPIVSLTFNDVEANEKRTALYPPSDVQLMKSAQLEWNRTRNSLKTHRTANRPKYISTVPLRDEDKLAIQYADDQAVIELKGLPAGTDASKVLTPMMSVPIDSTLYDTTPLKEDLLMAVGMQEANLGPTNTSGDTTATEATISEQSRLSAASSNVDDLDDFLSDLAKISGELMVYEMSYETFLVGAGRGAVRLPANRSEIANEVVLSIEAASSGRPNKAMDVANFERMAPWLIQAGANPTFLVQEGVKRLDDSLDVKRAFPLQMPQTAPMGGAAQPLQTLPSESPVPLAGANPS